MTSGEKIHRVTLLTHLAVKRLRADVLKRYPDINAHELEMRVVSHRVPADLMQKVFRWDSEITDDRYDKENELEEQMRQAHLKDYQRRRQSKR